jgi:ribonuclease-3
LIGAIYLDSGFKVVENFILKYWNDEIKKTIKIEIDPKTKLQEYSLKYFKKLPIYKVLSYKGPQHNPSYKVSVKIHDSKSFSATGNSKKIAEHNAARKIINELKIK